jgi:hypothetical protein
MADQGDVAEIELVEDGGEIGGQGVGVVAVSRLIGARVPAPVIGSDRGLPKFSPSCRKAI